MLENKILEPSLKDIIIKSLSLYKSKFKPLFIIGLLTFTIIELVNNYIISSGLAFKFNEMSLSQNYNSMHSYDLLTLLFFKICIFCISVYSACLIQVIIYRYWHNKNYDLSKSIKVVNSVIFTLIFVSFVIEFLISIGFIFIIVPGIFLMALFIVYIPVVFIEQLGFKKSISVSYRLSTLNFGHCFLLSLFITVLLIIPVFFEYLAINAEYLQSNLSLGISDVLKIISLALIFPLINSIRVTLYYALKIKQQNL